MQLLKTVGWQDYELLDSGNGLRLERFGQYIISKPDPQAIWQPHLSPVEWDKADAKYLESGWSQNNLPEKWPLAFQNIKFYAKLTPFKHTGVFPEQVLNWEFIEDKISKAQKPVNLLNLFGYTGIASLVAAKAGAKVTHVDGSKPSITWARENQTLSGLLDKPIRWILDDATEFTAREARRDNVYDAIITDPPVYGHGPNGETWDFNQSFPKLLENCKKILSPNPVFVIVNAYAISSSSLMLVNTMEDYLGLNKENIEYGELALEQKSNGRLLSTGLFARYCSL
ncbi:MAG: class I SAM-dependent methyltransferase [Candidatus Levyibacteriota bacterium]|jgi:23S rRNA (cytosine1962-C5)-methyltransferase